MLMSFISIIFYKKNKQKNKQKISRHEQIEAKLKDS